jgi:acyl-CoA thioesterase
MSHEIAEIVFSKDRYAALTGIELIENSKGYCKARMKIEDKHLNGAGIVQGGAIFTLADVAFAVAANSQEYMSLTINVNISFLSGRSKGILFATATEVSDPNRLGAYDVLITDEESSVVARFNGMVYRKQRKSST